MTSNMRCAHLYDGMSTMKSESIEIQEAGRNSVQDDTASNRGTLKGLTRTISRSSHIDPGPPPDGGLVAWTQAIIGHLLFTNTWGVINSFGVFQTSYVSELGFPPSNVS